ncbi:MAG: hypothetical protein GEV11_18490 [Streptosporangiales bacterium]|nr:hypothetical protein [Streptosporangiales bacterium]
MTFVDKGFERSPADDFEYSLVLRVGHYFETLAAESRPRRECGCVDVDMEAVDHEVEGIVLNAYRDTLELHELDDAAATATKFEEYIGAGDTLYFQGCLGAADARRECGCLEVDVNTAERYIRRMALQAHHEIHQIEQRPALQKAS